MSVSGTVGLHNLGNTCYMNSVIQMLVHSKVIRNYLMNNEFINSILENITKINNITNDEINKRCRETITLQLSKLCSAIWNNTNNIAPLEFKHIVGLKNEMFAGNEQNDSHELLNYILDAIHEETKKKVDIAYERLPQEYHEICIVRNKFNKQLDENNNKERRMIICQDFNKYKLEHQKEILIYLSIYYLTNYIKSNYSIVSQNILGTFNTCTTCTECSNKSYRFDVYTTLSLPIPNKPNVDIYDCFDLMIADNVLKDNNMYECSNCNHKTISVQKTKLWMVPEILFIIFKRFSYDKNRMTKNNVNITYPIKNLQITKYINEYNQKNFVYDLKSVVHHYGNYDGGHYISFCATDDYTTWNRFDDSRISLVKSVEEFMTSNSYILMYERRN